MANSYSDDNLIIEQLKSSVKAIMDKTGSSKFAHDLMERIHALQQRLETLSNNERSQFIEEMKESFRATIETVENKLMQHAQFEKAYTYSIYAAIIFLILFVFGGFSNCASTVYSCSPPSSHNSTKQLVAPTLLY